MFGTSQGCSGPEPDFGEQDGDTWHDLILADYAKWASNFYLGIFQRENDQIIHMAPGGISIVF